MSGQSKDIDMGEATKDGGVDAASCKSKERRVFETPRLWIEQGRSLIRRRMKIGPTSTNQGARRLPRITLNDMPQEILEMIIARVPFDMKKFLGLRLVCRRFRQTISLGPSQCFYSKVANQSFPFTQKALPMPKSGSFKELLTLQCHALTIQQIINEVMTVMSLDDYVFESNDWPDKLFKGLLVWQRFRESCLKHRVNPSTLSADNQILNALSIETHLLLRYVGAKLQRCLNMKVVGPGSDHFNHWGAPRRNSEWNQVANKLATALGLMRPDLGSIRDLLLQARGRIDEPTRRETESSSETILQSVGRHASHIHNFVSFLFEAQPWDPDLDNLTTWLCQHPPRADLVGPGRYQHLRGLAHYEIIQTLFARMLELEHITDGLEYIDFAGKSFHCLSNGLSSRMVGHFFDAINDNQLITMARFEDFLTTACNPTDILDANLLNGSSKLRKSISDTDRVFETAIAELDSLDEQLEARTSVDFLASSTV